MGIYTNQQGNEPTVHEHVQWHRRRWEVHTKDLNCWSINLLRLGRFIDGIYVDSPWWNPSFPYFSDKSPEKALKSLREAYGNRRNIIGSL